MIKKLLIAIAIVFSAALAFWSYTRLKTEHLPPLNTLNAVPVNAASVVIVKNLHTFYTKTLSSNLFWEELSNIKKIKSLHNSIKKIDSTLTANTPLKSLLQPELIISAHNSGANKYDYIFTIQLKKQLENNNPQTQLEKLFNTTISTRSYDNQTIYTINLKHQKLYTFFSGRIASFSFSSILIEDVVRHFNSTETLLKNTSFQTVYNTLGSQAPFYVLVNPKKMLQINAKHFKRFFEHYQYFSDWMAFDGEFTPNILEFNGFSIASDSLNHYLALFKNTKKKQNTIINILPKNTAYYNHFTIDNAVDYFIKYKQFLKGVNKDFKRQKHLSELDSYFETAMEKELLPKLVDEIAMGYMQPQIGKIKDKQFVIVKCAEADKTLMLLTQKSQQQTVAGTTTYTINQKIDFSVLLNPVFPIFAEPVVFKVNDFLVFTQNFREAEHFIMELKREQTLANNDEYQALSNNISEESNWTVYINIPRSELLTPYYFNEKTTRFFEKNKNTIQKYEAVVWQSSYYKNNLFYQRIFAKYNPQYKLSTSSLWELALDTTFSYPPQTVLNHKTNVKEIVLQDHNNTLYLISPTGKILWKRKLPLPIESKIYQIDRYKNGKLQLLFNTKEKIYLIDRNGNNVENFPIKLPAEATTGLNVVDYDKNRKYRILIPCINNMVYNYAADGTQVKGWEFSSSESPVIHIYPHFAINEKDYLTFIKKDGSVLITGRNGKERLAISETIPFQSFIAHTLKVGKSLKQTKIIGIDTLGLITTLTYDNVKEQSKLSSTISAADFGEIDNNKTIDVTYADNNKIYAYTLNNAKLFDAEIGDNIINVKVINKQLHKWIGCTTAHTKQVYLYTPSGRLLADFPVSGHTPFTINDIDNDGYFNLIIGDKNILLNYRLEK